MKQNVARVLFVFLPNYDQANYSHDSTMYSPDKRASTIIDSLSHEFTIWLLTQINGHLCC